MARLVLCVLALCVAGAFADPRENWSKLDATVLKARQVELLELYYHIHEPLTNPKLLEIASTWRIENNYEKYNNITATKTYAGMLKNNWHLPRAVPFAVDEPAHAFEAMTLFYTLYSAKDYETFYKTVVYLRDIVNEGLFVYVLSISVIYREDTQGIALPSIYEVFPSYFNNGEIMTTAQRINTHGHRFVKNYPSTYLWDDNVVIRWNATAWPYFDKNFALSYFTNDYDLNAAQYFMSLVNPYWLGGDETPVIFKESRGEAWWFAHRQLLARYYMERLSIGFGEIPDFSTVIKDGYSSGLLYHNGVPFPSRPNNFHVDQPEFATVFEQSEVYEQRIWEAIDKGFFINRKGENISLLTDTSLNTLGLLIESNADSPNRYYYKDFIRLWKKILGNSIKSGHQYASHFTPLVIPSALENYQTSLRDPAFFIIWKRILNLFVYWQKQMPLYKPEELSLPTVSIEKVETDKLVTYFENTYMNITSHLFQTEAECTGLYDDVKVLVQHPRLNHKLFSVRVTVKSEAAKKVLVKFFLAPKYDGQGYEIPLHLNTENFFLLDHFQYDLPGGESIINRKSTDFGYTAKDWPTGYEIYEQVLKGEWKPVRRSMNVFPQRLLLPKGRVGGMKFQLVVFITEIDGIKGPSRKDIIGFPADRPLYSWQVKNVKNLWFEDVSIFHKEVPEVFTPHTY